MKEEEYLEELKKNGSIKQSIEISTNLNAIVLTLIKNNLITEKQYEKLVDQSKENLYKYTLKNMTDIQKQGLETNKKFRNLFGMELGDLIWEA